MYKRCKTIAQRSLTARWELVENLFSQTMELREPGVFAPQGLLLLVFFFQLLLFLLLILEFGL